MLQPKRWGERACHFLICFARGGQRHHCDKIRVYLRCAGQWKGTGLIRKRIDRVIGARDSNAEPRPSEDVTIFKSIITYCMDCKH
jgi:hypothetical protein